ncbi:MAG: TraR/DksA C4-type zinc finger protein [bacterium]|nr:TraR/DksA C4-type zinc finger protein [bacterium]
MDKKLLLELKEKLEKQKELIEKELGKFAEKDKNIPGDWDTRYPRQDNRGSGSSALEGAADEVEEYSTLLPIEHSLENRLQAINLSLEKIKKGTYGKCENCNKDIEEEKLKACPEAKLCLNCQPK